MEMILGLNLDEIYFNPILSGEDDYDDSDGSEQGGVATVVKKKVKRPRLYKVLLHNDDCKTMDEAKDIMLKVHNNGVGICGIYTFEVAESKVEKVKKEAKDNGHPLLCTYEPE